MRKLNELIVLIRGGGAVGSAIAQRLAHSHFRVCITELTVPTAICRGVSLSESIFDGQKVVEDITGEKTLPNLEHLYKAWRNEVIPVIADPDMTVRALLKPDVLINAMMLGRESNIRISDAPLVIGIGTGFTAGIGVHLVVESTPGLNLGRVIFEGKATTNDHQNEDDPNAPVIIRSEDTGIFNTQKNIGDRVEANEIIGSLNEVGVLAPKSGVLRGLLRNETRVLTNTRLAAIDPNGSAESCAIIGDKDRAIAGGVLEAIMLSFNDDVEN